MTATVETVNSRESIVLQWLPNKKTAGKRTLHYNLVSNRQVISVTLFHITGQANLQRSSGAMHGRQSWSKWKKGAPTVSVSCRKAESKRRRLRCADRITQPSLKTKKVVSSSTTNSGIWWVTNMQLPCSELGSTRLAAESQLLLERLISITTRLLRSWTCPKTILHCLKLKTCSSSYRGTRRTVADSICSHRHSRKRRRSMRSLHSPRSFIAAIKMSFPNSKDLSYAYRPRSESLSIALRQSSSQSKSTSPSIKVWTRLGLQATITSQSTTATGQNKGSTCPMRHKAVTNNR